jgi:hypothetical protein
VVSLAVIRDFQTLVCVGELWQDLLSMQTKLIALSSINRMFLKNGTASFPGAPFECL